MPKKRKGKRSEPMMFVPKFKETKATRAIKKAKTAERRKRISVILARTAASRAELDRAMKGADMRAYEHLAVIERAQVPALLKKKRKRVPAPIGAAARPDAAFMARMRGSDENIRAESVPNSRVNATASAQKRPNVTEKIRGNIRATAGVQRPHRCTECHEIGHNRRRCPELFLRPPTAGPTAASTSPSAVP